MSHRQRSVLVVVVAALVLLGLAWRYYTAREPFPAQSEYRIDLDALEALARGGEGPLPVAVQSLQVAEVGLPRALVFAGESFAEWPMSHGAFRIVYPDGRAVMVDSAFGPGGMKQFPYEGRYDDAAFATLEKALLQADAIVLTHEHFDHIAGLGEIDDVAALAPRLHLNPEQLASDEAREYLSDALRARLVPLDYAQTLRIAPGVVLLRAPGHTPGSQMVYVQRAAGKALLLIGDVAWHLDQVRNEHYRPRLVTDLVIGEDRHAVLHQMRALQDLLDSERVAVVSSHDIDDRRRLIAAGLLEDGFRPL